MADDSDVPPLEDMTEILKKADAIRESRNGPSRPEKSSAKARAKVVKKPAVRVVSQDESGKGDAQTAVKEKEVKISAPAPAVKSSNSSMFGGMKKGFLFGGSGKSSQSTRSSPATNCDSLKPRQEDLPYISPKTTQAQSGLTLDEVQQAMSEAKGLLENQDWITEDLLSKIEKNETLGKKFADVRFMQALEEFQKDPNSAMQKYKGNHDVEKFLQEFCGLLGDHFTSMGDNSSQQKSHPSAQTSAHSQSQTAAHSAPMSSSTPKITEICANTKSGPASTASSTKAAAPKIVELTEENTKPSSKKSISSSKNIVELSDNKDVTPPALSKLRLDSGSSRPRQGGGGGGGTPDILTYSSGAGADMQEVSTAPAMADEEVKEILKDEKVMATLMDPQIMNIIQLLRTDPEKAQRIVDSAQGDLKEKITLLILKGLLRFQAS